MRSGGIPGSRVKEEDQCRSTRRRDTLHPLQMTISYLSPRLHRFNNDQPVISYELRLPLKSGSLLCLHRTDSDLYRLEGISLPWLSSNQADNEFSHVLLPGELGHKAEKGPMKIKLSLITKVKTIQTMLNRKVLPDDEDRLRAGWAD
jgi:hypothetical protein